MLFDTHAHLFWEEFDEDREEVMVRARDSGVVGILNLGTTPDTSRQCIELAERFPECWAAVGFHPNDIHAYQYDPTGGMAQIAGLARHPRVIAIGETGIDLYRGRDTREIQVESLRRHFDLARELEKPVILHNREADADLREVLERFDEGVTAVLHCFTSDEAFGVWAIERGHYLGLGGVFTFRSSDLRETVGNWDLDHLLLETDSPFLAPVPHRGKRNEPAYILHTAQAVAQALDMDVPELARSTTENARRLFDLT